MRGRWSRSSVETRLAALFSTGLFGGVLLGIAAETMHPVFSVPLGVLLVIVAAASRLTPVPAGTALAYGRP